MNDGKTEPTDSSADAFGEYLNTVCKSIASEFNCDRVSVTRVADDGAIVTYVSVYGVSTPDTATGASYLMPPPVRELFSRHDATSLDMKSFKQLADIIPPFKSLSRAGIKSMIISPLAIEGQVIGSISASWRNVSDPRLEQLSTLVEIANEMSLEIGDSPEFVRQAHLLDESNTVSPTDSRATGFHDEPTLQLVHELKTPLTCILAFLELVMKSEAVPDRQRSQIESALRNASRMHRLVQLILDNSRLNMSGIESSFTPVKVSDLANDVLRDIQPIVQANNQTIALSVDDPDCSIKCDYSIMSSILNNVLTNASQYSDCGAEIIVQIERDGDSVVVSVSDEGVGMTAEQIRHAGEPFFRGFGPHNSNGHGLGLSFVKAAIEKHAGVISFDSVVGEGTDVVMVIPICKDEETQLADGALNAFEMFQPPGNSLFGKFPQ